MRFSALAFTLILLSSSMILAQHSSGGGGSAGGSSAGGSSNASGGGSHGSTSSGSSYSSGSSGGHSAGTGSTSHVSTAHGTSAPISSHIKAPGSAGQANPAHGVYTPNLRSHVQTAPAEKRSIFSFLRHPFHRPQPKAVADLRRPVCFRGPCPVCPAGQVNAGGGCGGVVLNRNNVCSSWEIWSGGACVQRIYFLNNCNSLRASLQQQAQRLRAAQAAQQTACSMGSIQDCSETTNASRSEENLYRSLQNRYQRCQQQFATQYPFGNYFLTMYHADPLFDSLSFDAEYPLDLR